VFSPRGRRDLQRQLVVHSSHSVTMVGLAWMQTSLQWPGLLLVNLWGTFGGADDDVAGSGGDAFVAELERQVAFSTTQVSS
jgi:hypothetical protein